MIILWPNEDHTFSMSHRRGRPDHVEPVFIPNPLRVARSIAPVPSSVIVAIFSYTVVLTLNMILNKWHPAGSIRMAFDMHANETALAESPIERLIWAYGMTRPGSKLPNTEVLGHFAAGYLKIDFSKEALPIPPVKGHQTSDGGNKVDSAKPPPANAGDSATLETTTGDAIPYGKHEKLIIAHGVMLSLGFLVFLPTGALVARWGRTFTSSWFKAHSIINMSIALPIICIGWLLGPIAVACHEGEHMATAHQVNSFYNANHFRLAHRSF